MFWGVAVFGSFCFGAMLFWRWLSSGWLRSSSLGLWCWQPLSSRFWLVAVLSVLCWSVPCASVSVFLIFLGGLAIRYWPCRAASAFSPVLLFLCPVALSLLVRGWLYNKVLRFKKKPEFSKIPVKYDENVKSAWNRAIPYVSNDPGFESFMFKLCD